MTRILLAVNDGRLADHLYGLAGESEELEIAGSVRDPQELRGGISRTDVDAVIVHDGRGTPSLLELTRELSITQPDLGLVLIVGDDGPENVLRAGMQAGARDVLTQPITLDALEMSVLAAAAWTQALRRRAARESGGELHGVGRVLTVAGGKGGVGTTTVAIHLALAARRLGTASVCLVEYDLQAGDIRSFLDLPYRRSVVDLVPVAEELTTRNLQESLYTHESGMRVLLAPQDGEQSDQVSAAAARNILTAIRTREDLTIVDAGATLSEASAIAAEMSDTVLVVSTPDVVSLRGVTRMTGLWDRLKIDPPEVAMLLNRVSRRMEIQPDLARRVVPIPVLETTVAADFSALEAAVNTGIPNAGDAAEPLMGSMAAVLGEVSAISRPDTRAAATAGERRRRLAARLAGESGQATVEFLGVLPVFLIVALVIWQIVLVAATFVFAGHAARAGASALAVGNPVASAAKAGLPSAWRAGTEVTDSTSSGAVGTVTVATDVPLLFPGLGVIPIHTSDSTVIEDQLLGGEQNPLLLLGGGAGLILGATGMPKISQIPAIPGDQPKLVTIGGTGDATLVPAQAWPEAVKKVVWAADALIRYPYCWGGGHIDFSPRSDVGGCGGYDCSGSVSFALAYAGLLRGGPEVSGDFEHYGAPGSGSYITLYASADHVHMVIDDQYDFDTNGVKDGPGWYDNNVGVAPSSYGPQYSVTHPVGY